MAGTYKNFLRLLEKWPLDSTKQKRDIGVHIREQIKLQFGAGGLRKPVDQENCDKQFYSLKKIVDNHYKTLYHRSSASSATGLNVEQCKQVLSDEYLEYLEDQRDKIILNVFNKPIELKKKPVDFKKLKL